MTDPNPNLLDDISPVLAADEAVALEEREESDLRSELDPRTYRPTREDNRIFQEIDREQENRDIAEWQRTRDMELMTKLYILREPTLWVWAQRFAYLANNSPEDLFMDLRPVWMRALERYDIRPQSRPMKNRRTGQVVLDERGELKMEVRTTDFNTLLFTYCKHHMINLYKKHRSQKRCDHQGVPVSTTMRSLDEQTRVGVDRKGSELHERLSVDNPHNPAHSLGAIDARDIIDAVVEASNNDPEVREAMERYAYSDNFALLSKACQIRTGQLPIGKAEWFRLARGGKIAEQRVQSLIRRSKKYPDVFWLRSYHVTPQTLEYEVATADWELFEKVTKAVRKVQARFAVDRSLTSGLYNSSD